MSARLCGLERAAAMCRLARSIYEESTMIEGRSVPPWVSLAFNERHPYLRLAEVVVAAAGPVSYWELAAELARTDAARIIGTITPAAPWGLDDSQGRD
jgi:hypothetical protein